MGFDSSGIVGAGDCLLTQSQALRPFQYLSIGKKELPEGLNPTGTLHHGTFPI